MKREHNVPSFSFIYNITLIEEKISSLLEQKFQEEEFLDCFLVEIRLNHKKLDVFIDADSGITFRKCQQLSRYLESFIDEEGWLGEKYVLEVSSPGIGRPLQLKRQYKKNIGRKLEVSLLEGKKQEGKLIAVNENGITIEYKQRIKEGKKKRTEVVQDNIPFEEINKAIVKITF